EPSSQWYFRVKHDKITYFLNATSTDNLSNLKKNLVKLMPEHYRRDPKRIRLSVSDGLGPPTYTPLDKDNETLVKLGLQDEQALFVSFWDEEEPKWKPVLVEYPDPMAGEENDDEDSDELEKLETQLEKVALSPSSRKND
ncbi:1936_t:CDS:2, partial [Ambispora gerdemannii]